VFFLIKLDRRDTVHTPAPGQLRHRK